MKKRPPPTLDSLLVSDYQQSIESYQIQSNNSLQLRAFILTETGAFTNDGRRLHGTVKKEDINMLSLRNVGHGNSGGVYFAKLNNGMPVALKRIPISSKSHRDEIDRELQFFSSVNNCEFVMRNYGAFWDPEDGAIVIPMEWMAYSLKELSEFWHGMEESVLRDILFQVVTGLVYLHDVKRVIHRDIKPSNLLVREDGVVKIADFGVSKLVQTLDVSSTYVGTMYFMAPERLEQSAYGFNSDMWSLGLTAIAIVTGHNPWAPPDNMNLFQLLNKISGDTIPTLPTKLKYSDAAHNFIRQCLIRDPDERPSSSDLLNHEFFKNVTAESAIANVKVAVEYMTRLINNDTKKNRSCQRTPDDVANEVCSKLEKLVNTD